MRFWVDGKQRERSFQTRKEADDFKIKTDHDVRAQIFVDDRAGRQRFADAATAWLDRKAIAEGTKRNYRAVVIAAASARLWHARGLGGRATARSAKK